MQIAWHVSMPVEALNLAGTWVLCEDSTFANLQLAGFLPLLHFTRKLQYAERGACAMPTTEVAILQIPGLVSAFITSRVRMGSNAALCTTALARGV